MSFYAPLWLFALLLVPVALGVQRLARRRARRFALRFDLTDNTDLTKISKDLEALIPKKDWKYVNNGFVLYGRYICPARPHDCLSHPLTKLWPPAATRWPRAK